MFHTAVCFALLFEMWLFEITKYFVVVAKIASYWARSQNYEKRLLASSCLSVRM
jgi:hypothetical protein